MPQAQRTTEQLITAIREHSNEETANPASAFVTDIEILRRLVENQYSLYDLLLQADESLFMLSANFTLTSSNVYALSGLADPGFYRLIALEYTTGGTPPRTVRPYNFHERNNYSGTNFAGSYTIYYTPRLVELVALGTLDTFTDNYQRYLIAATAADVMAKAEESDPSSMLALKASEEARILGSVMRRTSEPDQIPDVTDYANWDNAGGERAYTLQGSSLVIR